MLPTFQRSKQREMIFTKKTKWIPLGNYSFSDKDYVVFVRANLKTGMMFFKVKNIHRFVFANRTLPVGLIDVAAAWKEITNLINLK